MLRLTLAFYFFSPALALAAIGTGIGFSAKGSSLGGMSSNLERDGLSAFYNPAQMSQPRNGHSKRQPSEKASPETQSGNIQFTWGFIFMEPQFKAIPGPVVTQNTTNGDAVVSGSVDTDYPTVIGQAIGLNYRNKNHALKPSFGLVIYLPIDRFALIDSGEPFLPDYVLYRSRLQKPEFHFGAGLQLKPQWRLGAGVQLGAGLNAKTDVFLQPDSSKSSSMRIAASLKTKASPYFGTQIELTPAITSGLTFRLPLSNPQTLQVRASGRVIGDLSALDFSFQSLSTAYYEPMQVEWGNTIALPNDSKLHLQLDYQAWSRYESPNLEIDTTNTSNCAPNCGGLVFASSKYPSFTTKDVFVPRVGLELGMFRVGYAYESSIFSDPPVTHNLLDPSRHRISAGYGFHGSDFIGTFMAWTLDFSATYSVLESYSVQKSGDAIGAPGFDVGGNLFGGGVSLNLSL